MRILIVGSGAREHTIAWKIVQSSLVEKVCCVPGNPGIAQIAECRSIPLEDNFSAIRGFCRNGKDRPDRRWSRRPACKGHR